MCESGSWRESLVLFKDDIFEIGTPIRKPDVSVKLAMSEAGKKDALVVPLGAGIFVGYGSKVVWALSEAGGCRMLFLFEAGILESGRWEVMVALG